MGERNKLLKLTYLNPDNEQHREDLRRIRNFVNELQRAQEIAHGESFPEMRKVLSQKMESNELISWSR